MKTEIVWMDYTRCIGIFLVVLGHTLQAFWMSQDSDTFKTIYDYVYLFHMPLFFIISGFLFKGKEHNKLNGGGKIVKSILYPYLIYQFVFLFWQFVIYRHDIGVLLIAKLLMGIIMGDGYNTPYSIAVCLPCWFLVSIIQLRLLFIFVPINKFSSVILIIASICFLTIQKLYDFDLYFCLDSTIMAIPYFIVGHYLGKQLKTTTNKNWLLLTITLFCGVVVALILGFNGAAQMNGPSFGKNIIANYVAGISGSLMVFTMSMFIANYFKARNSIRTISRNTLFIIFFHWLLLVPCNYVVRKYLVEFCSNNICILSMPIVISLIILATSKFAIDYGIVRYPILFGKQKQKRMLN